MKLHAVEEMLKKQKSKKNGIIFRWFSSDYWRYYESENILWIGKQVLKKLMKEKSNIN